MTQERMNIEKVLPNAYKPLIELDTFVQNSSITKTEYYLIEVRVAQINGCAFCIQMHTKQALENGEDTLRLFALNAWKDSPLFTTEEQVILALAEQITHISKNGVSDETFNKAIELFGEEKVAEIIMAIVNINAWTRIGRATKLEPM